VIKFSPGTPASSTTKTGRHDIAEILLKVTLNTTLFQQGKNNFCLGWYRPRSCLVNISLKSNFDLSDKSQQWTVNVYKCLK
jgi:hypothetical protein